MLKKFAEGDMVEGPGFDENCNPCVATSIFVRYLPKDEVQNHSTITLDCVVKSHPEGMLMYDDSSSLKLKGAK